MSKPPNTVVGYVVDVQGSLLTATLVEDEQGHAPTVTDSEREATNQTAFFRDCLLEAGQQENATANPALGLRRVTVDTPIYFSLDDILTKVHAKNTERVGSRDKQGPMFGNFDRFLMRIEPRFTRHRLSLPAAPGLVPRFRAVHA